MKKLLYAALAVAALGIQGCAMFTTEISGATPGLHITNSTIVTDLQSAAYNLDQALAVGALALNDPAPACMHDVLVKAGIEIPPGQAAPKTFTPRHDGIASTGAIAYIIAQQAKQAAATAAPVSANCEALVGRIVIDSAKATGKAAPTIMKALW